jgi:Transporter associated domain
VEALPLPPTASVLVVIRDGIARSVASAPPLAPGDYVLALARPQDLVLLDRLFGPRPERSRADERGLLGEFSFEGTTALAAIAHLYDPTAEAKGALTLAEFLASRFDGRPAIGDRTRFGAVELIVRDMQGDAITAGRRRARPRSQASVALLAPGSPLEVRMSVAPRARPAPRNRCPEQRSEFGRAGCFIVSARRCGLRRPVISFCRHPGSGADNAGRENRTSGAIA